MLQLKEVHDRSQYYVLLTTTTPIVEAIVLHQTVLADRLPTLLASLEELLGVGVLGGGVDLRALFALKVLEIIGPFGLRVENREL